MSFMDKIIDLSVHSLKNLSFRFFDFASAEKDTSKKLTSDEASSETQILENNQQIPFRRRANSVCDYCLFDAEDLTDYELEFDQLLQELENPRQHFEASTQEVEGLTLVADSAMN